MNKTIGMMATGALGAIILAGCGVSHSNSLSAGSSKVHHALTTVTSSKTTASATSTPAGSAPVSAAVVRSKQPSVAVVSLIQQWMQSGLNGRAVNIPVGDQQNLAAVTTLWGSAGTGSAVGSGIYFTYKSHDAAFGVNVGEQIFDVRSYASSLYQITRTDLVSVLGQPGAIRYADGTTIYLYPDGPSYQMLWVFAGADQTVNHVDVAWPQGTVNLMAQTLPNPSIIITTQPGQEGTYFNFTIQQPPLQGYQLAELEWIPSGPGGNYVVDTESQAMSNARIEVKRSAFLAVNGGYRFYYGTALQGQMGQVRLIYERATGAAIIGTSKDITLK